MIISLVWLIFYYVQRFRYLQTKDRKSVSGFFVQQKHILATNIEFSTIVLTQIFWNTIASAVQRCKADHRQNTDQKHQVRRQTDRKRLLCNLHWAVQGDGFDSHATVSVSTIFFDHIFLRQIGFRHYRMTIASNKLPQWHVCRIDHFAYFVHLYCRAIAKKNHINGNKTVFFMVRSFGIKLLMNDSWCRIHIFSRMITGNLTVPFVAGMTSTRAASIRGCWSTGRVRCAKWTSWSITALWWVHRQWHNQFRTRPHPCHPQHRHHHPHTNTKHVTPTSTSNRIQPRHIPILIPIPTPSHPMLVAATAASMPPHSTPRIMLAP